MVKNAVKLSKNAQKMMVGNVDNWAVSGLVVGINKNGYLKKYAYYKSVYGRKVEMHSDTKIKFEDFKAPMYDYILELAYRSYRYFYMVMTIGCDIDIYHVIVIGRLFLCRQ